MEREFWSMMPHTVTVAPLTGRNAYGVPQYGTPRAYRARIVGKLLSLRKADREDSTVVFDVYVDCGDDVITVHDQLTLDGDPAWVDGTPKLFAVARVTDEHGHHHVKMQCGWVYHRQGQ